MKNIIKVKPLCLAFSAVIGSGFSIAILAESVLEEI